MGSAVYIYLKGSSIRFLLAKINSRLSPGAYEPRVSSQGTHSMNVLFPKPQPQPQAAWQRVEQLFPSKLSYLFHFVLMNFFSLVQLQLVYIKILAQPRAWGVMSQALCLRDSMQD